MTTVNAQEEQNTIYGPVPDQGNGVLDGIYLPEHIPTKKVVQYEHVREADVIWEQKVWRTIDLRQKANFQFYYPLEPLDDRISLWDIFSRHINTEEPDMMIFWPTHPEDNTIKDGDQFKYRAERDPSLKLENDSLYIEAMNNFFFWPAIESDEPLQVFIEELNDFDDSTDADGNLVYPELERDAIIAQDVVQYKIKEHWFFDKERSVLDVRILGIAPVVYKKQKENDTEKITGLTTLFWIYFPDSRYVLQNYYSYNPHNDAQRISFDDLFWKRKFDSFVHKSSNVYDREIKDYESGVDALYESEKVKEGIFKFEHDLWEF